MIINISKNLIREHAVSASKTSKTQAKFEKLLVHTWYILIASNHGSLKMFKKFRLQLSAQSADRV